MGLAEAVALHQQGQLDSAKALYRHLLDANPNHFDALHLLGVIARQQGDPAQAVDLIGRAIAVNPRQATAHCNLGAALQDLGQSQAAFDSYERAVQLNPRYALALSNRGNALRHLGRLDDAVASYEQALAVQPTYPEAWCNRAIALNDLGRAQDAVASAEQAIAARPHYADAWHARANAMQSLGHFEEALASYGRALSVGQPSGEMWCARGTALHRLGAFEEALASYACAIELRPNHPLAHQYRGNSLRALGRDADAIAAYRQALRLGGDTAQIGFALAALGASAAPESSPHSYVKALFNQYADHFDAHLVDQLGYRTPQLIDAALQRWAITDADTVDLGCGTGLCGPLLRGVSRALVGVDLSEKMLEKAAQRGVYDVLECADVGAWLAQRSSELDLIVAADVFVYIGALESIFKSAHDALRPAGVFCFSVEEGTEQGTEQGTADYTLLASNRYAHAPAYLERLAGRYGFEILDTQAHTLRQDRGADVKGLLMVLRKP